MNTIEAIAHHNVLPKNQQRNNKNLIPLRGNPYGVQTHSRILTMGVYHKRFDYIREFLAGMGFSAKEREVIFYMLRLFIYYGKVHPKAQTIAEEGYCSKRTVWYCLGALKEMGLIDWDRQQINGYQTSNWYRIDKLALAVARYLAERTQEAFQEWVYQLMKQFKNFWQDIYDRGIELDLSQEAPVKRKFI